MSLEKRRSNAGAASAVVWSLLLAAAVVAIGWFRARHGAEAAALDGFDPSGLLHPVWGLPQFSADYANGEAQLLKSLGGQAFRLAGFLPFSDRAIVTAMVALEALFLAVGAMLCSRAVEPAMPAWRQAATAAFFIAGTLFSCDLARWFHPYYGATYNYANGLGLAAVAMMLRGRPLPAGALIGIGAAIHPMISLFFGVAMAVVGLARVREIGLLRLLGGGAVAAVIAGGWALWMIRGSDVVGDTVDAAQFIALARLMSSHWFPVSLGVFGERSWETLLPFIGVILLLTATLRLDSRPETRQERMVALAVAVLVVLALIGAMVAEYSGVPALTKLALHRMSAIALLLAGAVAVPRLLDDLVRGSWLRAAMAGFVLASAFWRDHGPALAACIAYAALTLWDERRWMAPRTRAVRIAALAVAILVPAFLLASGTLDTVFAPGLSGLLLLRDPWFLAAFALLLSARALRSPLPAAVAVAVGLWFWLPALDQMRDPATLAQARAYREVQDWARLNTPPDSLFMTDPAHSYGWRQFSQRPSFGSLREWLYSGWIYDTRPAAFAEGLRRASLVGVDAPAIAQAAAAPGPGYAEIVARASRLYHAASPDFLAARAREDGIDYFVMDRTRMEGVPADGVVFRNDRYLVLKAP